MTLVEWEEYIASLSGRELWSKAFAANQIPFIRMLEEDGLSPKDITSILRSFAEQLVRDDQAPPSDIPGGYLDYNMLLRPIVCP